jgi:adenylate cyclase
VSETNVRQRLAAILAADAAGYSRLMAADDRATVAALDAARAVFRRSVESRQGRVVDMAGDSVLALFETVTGAVESALEIQRELAGLAASAPEDGRMRFRIGVHLGDVLEKPDGTVYGDGVNIAARLQALPEAGGIALSAAVKDAVCGRVAAVFTDEGESRLKNLPAPVRWCRVALPEAAGGISVSHARTAVQLTALPAIAQLPYRTASADVAEAALADGLRIDLQQALVKMSGLVLIGVGTTNTYRGKDVPLKQAAAEMGARYLVEGFVQKAGERARITVSLIDGESGQALWSEQYDRALDDTFEVQDEIVERIVTALDVKLLSGEQGRVWRKTLKHPRAREQWYRGMHEFMKGQPEANGLAHQCFVQAAKLAPESSLGPTMAAFTLWLEAFRGWTPTPQQSIDRAAEWAERALAMEDADGQAHAVMGHIHLYRREHDKALEVAEQAVAMRPSCTNSNAQLANILYYCGRPADAADRLRQAMRISPVHPPAYNALLGACYKELRLWGDASAACEAALRRKADDVDTRLTLVEVGRGSGDDEAARARAREVAGIKPDFSVSRWAATQPYRDPGVLERIARALRDAGLPD